MRKGVASDDRLVPLEEMQARFGEESIWVYNILRVRCTSQRLIGETIADPLGHRSYRRYGKTIIIGAYRWLTCSQGAHRYQVHARFQECPPCYQVLLRRSALDRTPGWRAVCSLKRFEREQSGFVAEDVGAGTSYRCASLVIISTII